MQIIIDPFTNVYYASFYIQGLIDAVGKSNVHYRTEPFLQLSNRLYNFNFILYRDEKAIKVSVDFEDFNTIHQECYHWCDVYGKVNTNWTKTSKKDYPKLISLAPSFGIRVWNIYETTCYAIINLIKTGTFTRARKFFGKYKRQYALRLPISAYQPGVSMDNYIFHVSTLWYNDESNKNDENVNGTRADFMEICRSLPGVVFEGGFYYTRQHELNPRFKELVFTDYLSVHTYLQKTKDSCVVFNTPAFWNCHGWKLGEYLALGKAIISTPLVNDLPEPLVHGENIHFIGNNKQEMEEAVSLLVRDKAYRNKLEQGARAYYLRNATPDKIFELIIND